jgi:8-oxo-dGTP pyrophosphatase MutT (NUDIX family)
VHDGRITTFTWLGKVDSNTSIARVYAIGFTKDGKILLVGSGDASESWWLPGGGVENGESQEEALRRELMEEAGASVQELELLGHQHVDDPVDGPYRVSHYWARIDVPSSFEPQHEVRQSLLVQPEQFLAHLFWSDDPAARRLLDLALEVESAR